MAINTTSSELVELSCESLQGIGSRLAQYLAKCGIKTVHQLLFHLPYRYQDRTRITPIKQARLGDQVVIEGIIEKKELSHNRRPALLCYLHDGTASIILRFFHYSQKQQQSLKPGLRLRCFGEVKGWREEREMIHPEYEYLNGNSPPFKQDSLTPIYPTTEGLTQRHWRLATDQALKMANEESLPDYLPASLLTDLQLPDLLSALHYVHRPPADAPVEELLAGTHPSQRRLAFEELLAHHLCLRNLRQQIQCYPTISLPPAHTFTRKFLANLPFQLTSAQQRVYAEITHDLIKTQPMLRLLQGDVGSGKTVIAALAALQAVENNYQVAIMAPTELLAEQHFQNFCIWLQPLGIEVAWLAGKLKGKARDQILEKIKLHTAQIIIGTHALFQEQVQFAALALIIIDEQHRFGVHQRLALREKGVKKDAHPHQLIMTATPIPRTLAMTAYADLDNSIIDELPPGRLAVKTVAIANNRRMEVMQHVHKAAQEGKQIYWVCPLITESEALQCQAAESTAEQLTRSLPTIRIGLVHGRQNAASKEQIMAAFKQGEIDLLVATTVVEVGVDVPNASLMVIENAERLGLAQLHQLRGRVGRGAIESFCVLLFQADRLSTQAKARLAVMRETNDGFAIARRDLELRGPGEVLGTRQAGMLHFKVADLLRDAKLLPKIQQTADKLLENYPNVIDALIRRWVDDKQRYVDV